MELIQLCPGTTRCVRQISHDFLRNGKPKRDVGNAKGGMVLLPARTQRALFCTDLKSNARVFYKAGTCERGGECKIGHSPGVEEVDERDV